MSFTLSRYRRKECKPVGKNKEIKEKNQRNPYTLTRVDDSKRKQFKFIEKTRRSILLL
jgi:hypothetical protein